MFKMVIFILTLLIWILPEVLAFCFIMPVGTLQEWDLSYWSYYIYQYIWVYRIVIGLLVVLLAVYLFMRTPYRILVISGMMAYMVFYYLINFQLRADKIFKQPSYQQFVGVNENTVPLDRLVIGIEINGESKAYPIQYLAYHHQVVDTVHDEPIIATYCSVCRTGRAMSSKVNGNNEKFRLVGMSQWNALLEDETTGSWWQQATGEAILGPLKGTNLELLYTQQVTLEEWFEQYPQSLVLQPDTTFVEDYSDYHEYEDGIIDGGIVGYDSLSWQRKSWVVGIELNGKAIAYDWNDLKKKGLIQHTFEGKPILLLLGADKSFRAWDRTVLDLSLDFAKKDGTDLLIDAQTQSVWSNYGECLEGELKGTQLVGIKAYQEYWHSWRDFHPNTIQYGEPTSWDLHDSLKITSPSF